MYLDTGRSTQRLLGDCSLWKKDWMFAVSLERDLERGLFVEDALLGSVLVLTHVLEA